MKFMCGEQSSLAAVDITVAERPIDASPPTVATTLLVVDVVASEMMLRCLGDEAFANLMDAFKDAADRVRLDHGGFEPADTGDGFIYAFAHVADALAAARAVQNIVDVLGGSGPLPLEIRCGIHHGSVVPTRHGLVGLAVYHAVEVGNAAGAGQIWMSSEAMSELPPFDVAGVWHSIDLPRNGLTQIFDVLGTIGLEPIRTNAVEQHSVRAEFPLARTDVLDLMATAS